MPLAAVVVALLLSPTAWRPVALVASNGNLTATVTYEAGNSLYVRNAHVTVLREGVRLVDRPLLGLWDGTISLHFRNVWGDASPELLVEGAACGNRCFDQLYVAIPATGRVVRADFNSEAGPKAWLLMHHDGRFEFVSDDGRFFCNFSDCASATTPVQVLAIDENGTAFVDVTRTRRDLLQADAKELWKGYLQEVAPGSQYDSLGTLVPWCADEYRLGTLARFDFKATCTHLIPRNDRRQLARWGDWFST